MYEVLFKVIYACERDILKTVSAIDLKLEICFHIIWRPSAKNKMAAIELFKMYAIDTHCERDIFRIVSPIDLKFDL